jgi:Malectin domain
MKRHIRFFILVLSIFLVLAPSLCAQSAVTITLSPNNPGATIPEDFNGVSYETSTLLTTSYFNSSNQPLLRMFSLLGIKSLRIGGNTSDSGTLPSQSEIASAVNFANAANVQLIYGLRLKTFSPSAAASTANFILSLNSPSLQCFAIGNEPDVYIGSYATYKSDAQAYMSAITNPRAKFCGPDVTGGASPWVVSYAQDFAPTGRIAHAQRHNYFGGSGTSISASAAIAEMLSTGLVSKWQANHDQYASQVLATGLGFRLSETNNFFSGGCPGASNAFASALWGLDYMYWWATHQASGLNFHTGDHVSGASTSYALFQTSSSGYHVHPLGYGVKAFDLGSHGRIVPVAISNPSGVNLTSYGVLDADNNLFVTIINKTYGSGAETANLTIQPGASYGSGEVWLLEAPNNDVTVTDGETLGGARIGDDASWLGTSTPVRSSGSNFLLTLPPATAAVVKLMGTSTVPPAPTGLTAVAGNNQVALSWTAAAGASTYNVKRSTTSGTNYTVIKSGLAATSFTDTTVTNGTTYFYVVSAQNAQGESPNSSQVSATPSSSSTSIAINAGGPAVSPFVADTDFAGGSTINHANTIDLTGVTNPAPMQVYQTARVGNFTYTIPGLTAGSSHSVRLHFAETFWTAAGKRKFNVSINGTQVLTSFDIFAAAGGMNKALIQQFTVNANTSGQYVIQFTSVVDKSLISGIEVQ